MARTRGGFRRRGGSPTAQGSKGLGCGKERGTGRPVYSIAKEMLNRLWHFCAPAARRRGHLLWGSARGTGKRTCTTMQLLLVLLASWRVVGDTLFSVDGRAALRELQPAGSIDLRIRASAARAGAS